jgi:hypothetical protein
LFALYGTIANAADDTKMGLGVGGQTCGVFAEAYRQDPHIAETIYFTWAQGYMSGQNILTVLSTGKTVDLSGVPITQLESSIREYCDSHPLALKVPIAHYRLHQRSMRSFGPSQAVLPKPSTSGARMLWRWLRKHREIQTLECELSKLYRARDAADVRSFRSGGASELAERDWNYEIASIEEAISELRSTRLRLEAIRYDTPLPHRSAEIANDPNWSMGINSGVISLTREGRRIVRDSIAREKQSRRAWWAWWMPLVFGLIGAVTGLVSVFRH